MNASKKSREKAAALKDLKTKKNPTAGVFNASVPTSLGIESKMAVTQSACNGRICP
jgi:hypothetical protein